MAKTEGVNKSQAIRDYYKSNPKAKTQEVVDALEKQGVTVTANLVTTVKSAHNKRLAVKKAASHVAEAKTMDKRPEVSKAQAVRDYLKAHRGASNKEVSAGLKAQGITVTPNHVATIKARARSGAGPSRRSSPQRVSISARSRRHLVCSKCAAA